MRITLIALSAALAGLAAALVVAAPSGADNGSLVGSVGPGFVISLADASGAAVKHLDPGTYTLLVHDKSDEHDFHLTGPGVNVTTDVTFVGDRTFTITVTDGNYSYICDPHATVMHGAFSAGNPPPPPATTTTPTPAPPPAKRASVGVGPGRRLTAPARLSAGRYTITARDSSATDNVHLKGPGVDRKTGVVFKGPARWTVTLRAGSYRVSSDAHRTLSRVISVG